MSGSGAVALVCSVAFLSLCMGMGGCSTPYQPRGLRGGYAEERLGSSGYLIQVSGNAYSSEELLRGHLERRARELCVDRGYTTWRFRGQPAAVSRRQVEAVVQCEGGAPGLDALAQRSAGPDTGDALGDDGVARPAVLK